MEGVSDEFPRVDSAHAHTTSNYIFMGVHVCVCRTTIKDYRRLFCHIICCPCVGFEISVVFIVHSQFTEKDFNWIGFVMEMNYHFFLV